MSLTKYFLIISLTVLASCSKKGPQIVEEKSFSEEEFDSLANRYQQLSYGFVQPSMTHRIYKDSAIMFRPANVENIQVGSYSYKKRGEHIQAMKMLNEAVVLDVANNSYDALQYRAWSYLYYYRDYEKTLKDIRQIDSMSKSDYSICWGEPCGFLKGQANYKLGNYDEALTNFQLVNTRETELGFDIADNFLNYFCQARCYHKMGDFETALKTYNYVNKIHDTYPQAYFWKGILLKEMGIDQQAIVTLNKARELLIDHKSEDPYFERFDEVFDYMIDEALEELEMKI